MNSSQTRDTCCGPAAAGGAAASQVSDLSEFRNSKSRHCGGEGLRGPGEGESGGGGGDSGSCRRPREEWMEREGRREGEGGRLKAPSFILPLLPPCDLSLSLSLSLALSNFLLGSLCMNAKCGPWLRGRQAGSLNSVVITSAPLSWPKGCLKKFTDPIRQGWDRYVIRSTLHVRTKGSPVPVSTGSGAATEFLFSVLI